MIKKLKGGLLVKKINESLTMPKETEKGGPLGLFNIRSVGKFQKIEGGPFGEFLKSLTEPKIL